MKWIPTVSTQSGAVLTAQNWEEAGVTCIAYSLRALLFKPGSAYLKTLTDFKRYTGWTKEWMLNCTLEDDLISPYDGSRLHVTKMDVVDIILNLKPTYTLLSPGFYQVGEHEITVLSAVTSLLVPEEEAMQYACQVEIYGKERCETDTSANDALAGRVYCSEGIIDISDPAYAFQFEPIDAQCECKTCQQHLTRAYLHYLFTHTPLLCQRFLVWHNVGYKGVGISVAGGGG